MGRVHIGIGSNLGRREENCLGAIRLMQEGGLKVLRRSSMHETEPWGVEDQPRFINMAVEAETGLSPRGLLDLLKDIEKRLGRAGTVRYGPRVIDLDILLCGTLVLHEGGLEIPHPRMHERGFVLGPLAEIAPDAVHPVLGKTVGELNDALRAREEG